MRRIAYSSLIGLLTPSKVLIERLQANGDGVIMHDEDNWSYSATSGLVECCSASAFFDDVNLEYKNGMLIPQNQQHAKSFGTGVWDGTNAWWFAPCEYLHTNAVTPVGKRGVFINADPVLHFHFDRSTLLLSPVIPLTLRPNKDMGCVTEQDLGPGSTWTWTGEDLGREVGGGVAWTVQGDVPMGITILLQLLRYYVVTGLHMDGKQLPSQTVPDFSVCKKEEISLAAATVPTQTGSATSSPEASPAVKRKQSKSGVDELASSMGEDDLNDGDVKPLPQETTINLNYSSLSRQESMTSTRTKVKRSRRRSVKLTAARRMSEQSSPSNSPRVMPAVE